MYTRTFLKSKIHRANCTETNLSYEGSIVISKKLLDAADIHEYERVTVVNVNNGARFDTYAVACEPDGVIGVMGAAARLVEMSDKLIIMSWINIEDGLTVKPIVVQVDRDNNIV